MKVLDGYPPNIDKITAVFPMARKKGVIFTYGDTIYAPRGTKVTSALQAHEQVHRQRQSWIGAEAWWDRYLEDAEFRFQEELMAHRAEYQWFRTYRRRKCSEMGQKIARRLCSELYGKMLSYRQALLMIET